MGSRILAAFVAVALAFASFADIAPAAAKPRARAAAGAGGDVVLVLTGVIGRGAYRQFRNAIGRSRPGLVLLDGPGGILGEALLIGGEIRRRGLSTAVAPNGACASACAVVFLSGRTKYMGAGAALGLHSASFMDGRESPEATGIMAGYLRSVGVPRDILRRMAATRPNEIRWLSRRERRALRIQTF